MQRFLYLAAVLMLIALPANAKQIKAGHFPTKETASAIEQGRFSAAEKHIIRKGLLQGQPFRKQHSALTALPGEVAKKPAPGKHFPPGWRDRVTLGKRLDFVVYRSSSPLPGATLQRLPPTPAGMEIIRVENSILRLQANTRVVLDIFDLRPK